MSRKKAYKSVSFRVERIYYEAYKRGAKKEEYRAATPYWYARLFEPPPDLAVIHTRGQPAIVFSVKATYETLTPEDLEHLIDTPGCYVAEMGELRRIRPRYKRTRLDDFIPKIPVVKE